MRDRARTSPAASTATAFTAVVPMSMPTVTEPDTAVIDPTLWRTSNPEGGSKVDSRPRALVTAPVRGPGLELLHELADLVIDPWIDQQPIRIYNAEQLAERAAAEGATILDRRGRLLQGGGLRATPDWRWPAPGVTPPTSTSPPPPPPASPSCGLRPATPTPWPSWPWPCCWPSNRGVVRADADVRTGETYRDGTIPYQRFRAWQLAGRTAGIVGLGAVGRALELATRGPGHAGRDRATPTRPTPPTASTPPRDLRRRVAARAGHPGDRRG